MYIICIFFLYIIYFTFVLNKVNYITIIRLDLDRIIDYLANNKKLVIQLFKIQKFLSIIFQYV